MHLGMKLAALAAGAMVLGGCQGEVEPAPETEAAAPTSASSPPAEVSEPTPAAPAVAEATAAAEPEAAPAAPAPTPVKPPLAFAQCMSCHAVEPGQNRVGPSLHGVFGRKAASVEGFNYSPALKEAGVTWDRPSLDTWLEAPMKMVPGSRMVLPVRDPAKRQEIIDYLETLK